MDNEQIKKWVSWINDNKEDLPFSYDEFLEAKDKYKFLDSHRDDIRSIPGSPSWQTPDLKKTIETLQTEYKSIEDVPMAHLRKLAKDNKTTVEDLKESFAQKQSEDRAKAKVEEEAQSREQRRKEIENLPWYGKILMSEASQRRYIDEPEKSAFYYEKRLAELEDEKESELEITKQQPFFKAKSPAEQQKIISNIENKYDTQIDDLSEKASTLSDRLDIGLGAAGATADVAGQFVAGPGAKFIGAGIRGVRDVKNKLVDDDINEKTWADITKGIGADVVSAAGTEAFANFPKYAKYLGYLGKESKLGTATRHATEAVASKQAAKSVNEGLAMTPNNVSTLSHKEATEWVKTLPESQYKNELLAVTNKTRGYSSKDLGDVADAWKSVEGGKFDFYNASNKAKDALAEKSEGALSFAKTLADTPELTKVEKGIAFGKEAWGKGTGIGVRGSQAALRDEQTPKPKFDKEAQLQRLGLGKESKKGDYQQNLDKIIANTKDQWDAGFVPEAIPGDPMYEAYLKYKRGK